MLRVETTTLGSTGVALRYHYNRDIGDHLSGSQLSARMGLV